MSGFSTFKHRGHRPHHLPARLPGRQGTHLRVRRPSWALLTLTCIMRSCCVKHVECEFVSVRAAGLRVAHSSFQKFPSNLSICAEHCSQSSEAPRQTPVQQGTCRGQQARSETARACRAAPGESARGTAAAGGRPPGTPGALGPRSAPAPAHVGSSERASWRD